MRWRPLDPPFRDGGFTLLELVFVVAIVTLLGTLMIPPLLRAGGRLQVQLAAAELAGALRLARSYAVRHDVNVAVKFYVAKGRRVGFALYRDGDGDGVRNADLRSGTDLLLVPHRDLGHFGRKVGFGFPLGSAPRDPSDPRRRLTRLDDPIRFNRSDLASFSPLGGATPGSLYLTDGSFLALVRVYNRTGKVSVRIYDPRSERWR